MQFRQRCSKATRRTATGSSRRYPNISTEAGRGPPTTGVGKSFLAPYIGGFTVFVAHRRSFGSVQFQKWRLPREVDNSEAIVGDLERGRWIDRARTSRTMTGGSGLNQHPGRGMLHSKQKRKADLRIIDH